MSRYIDADEVKKRMIPLSFSVQKWVSEVDLELVPTADVAEVVRCKDCKYHGATIDEQPTPSIMCAHMHDNDYCSYGKRRE